MSMDKCREAFEKWFKTTKAYQMLKEMNYFNMDLFHFVDGRNEYRHTSVQIAFLTWQSRQAEVDEQHRINVALNSENIKQREQITHYMNQCIEKRRRIRELQAKNNAVEHELGCALITPKEVFQ